MISDIQIKAIVDSLNKFQSAYTSYDVCLLTKSDLLKIVGKDNFGLLNPIATLSDDVVDDLNLQLMTPKSSECFQEPLFCRLNSLAYHQFQALNLAMQADTNKTVSIVSAYRSPAYQYMILLKQIYDYDFDLPKAKTLVATPNTSEHQDIINTAIDFDIENDKDPRYEWLTKHASSYGFTLSYGRLNTHNMQFEPWHWRFIKS